MVLPAGHTAEQRQNYTYEGLNMTASDVVYHSDREAVMDHAAIAELLSKPDVLPEPFATLYQSARQQ